MHLSKFSGLFGEPIYWNEETDDIFNLKHKYDDLVHFVEKYPILVFKQIDSEQLEHILQYAKKENLEFQLYEYQKGKTVDSKDYVI